MTDISRRAKSGRVAQPHQVRLVFPDDADIFLDIKTLAPKITWRAGESP
jgi:hypothetical protein